MADNDEILDFSFDDVVAQLDDTSDFVEEKTVEIVPNENVIQNLESENAVSDENDEVSEEEIVLTEKKETVAEEKSNFSEEKFETSKIEDNTFEKKDFFEEEDSIPKTEVKKEIFVEEEIEHKVLEENFVSENDEISFNDIEENVSKVESEINEEFVESTENEEIIEAGTSFNPLDPTSVANFLEKMGVAPDLIESKKCLIDVMQKENSLLDEILQTQTELHNFVREKNWEGLNEKLEGLQSLSDSFAELEEERETLCALIDMRTDEDLSPVLMQVRGKLQKSKIENNALNEYITTTRKFLQGVFDSVVPQRRNVRYSKNGKIVRPEISGVSLDISL